MDPIADGICPLCSQVHPHDSLHSHISSEHARVRAQTIEVIQAYHKGWAPGDGACEPCWKSFRDAGRILKVIKQTKQPGTAWKGVWPSFRA